MSTVIAPAPTTHEVTWGSQTFLCIQDGCDGTHHFWCSCER